MRITREGRGPRMLGMMGVVLAFALGFGAIRTPTMFGAQAVAIASVASVVVATLASVACRPRAFWFGLAAGGLASLFLATDLLSRTVEDVDLPSAAAWMRWDFAGYRSILGRCPYGMLSFRMIVLSQFAIAQGLICGALAALVARKGRFEGWSRRAATPSGVILILADTLVATVIAFRFCADLLGMVFVQLVYVALFTCLLGAIGGPSRTVYATAAILGWATLLWMVKGLNSPPSAGLLQSPTAAECFYRWLYTPPDPMEWDTKIYDSQLWWRWLLFGEAGGIGRLGWYHYAGYLRILQHAAALWALVIGLAVGRWAARYRLVRAQ